MADARGAVFALHGTLDGHGSGLQRVVQGVVLVGVCACGGSHCREFGGKVRGNVHCRMSGGSEAYGEDKLLPAWSVGERTRIVIARSL